MSSRHKPTPRKPKAAREAEKEARQLPISTLLKNFGKAAAFLTIAGVASWVSQLNLSPIYGSIPASLHHQRGITLIAVFAFLGKSAWKKYLPANIAEYISVISYWTPVIQFLLSQYSKQLGIEYGPLLIEGLTYFPLLFLSCVVAGSLLESIDLSAYNLPQSLADAAVPVGSYFTISSISKISHALLPSYVGSHPSFSRIGFSMLLGSVSAILTPSRTILFAFPAILHSLIANPHYPSSTALEKQNATLFATSNFTLLARQESITGYISVLENDADTAFRVLRCDHSLLGGEWLVTPWAYSKGQRIPETIFSVFVMLEAVRLVEDPDSDIEPPPDSDKSALVIGLGIGTAPNALISHGINTTIVELDPVVHYYASKYFDLSPNHTAVIDNAVAYVRSKSTTNPRSFNYIIHDVFTGGAEPVSLFTLEFFKGLYDLLTDDGVVAINYAGDLTLGSTRLVLNTIHSIFPACRLFRDTPQSADWKPGNADFVNMVVFCVKNDNGRGKFAIEFRDVDDDDFRGSLARKNYLRPEEQNEIAFEYLPVESGGRVMGRGDVGELEKYHKEGAVSHWRIMRDVLPDKVWEMW